MIKLGILILVLSLLIVALLIELKVMYFGGKIADRLIGQNDEDLYNEEEFEDYEQANNVWVFMLIIHRFFLFLSLGGSIALLIIQVVNFLKL